ncbi:TIGR02234 family membrane protein [Streptomyces gobiensis]|uniref:TIGR02234 family membrane protein n=1 Tax=Streptomyces gobiensis TaxID=2875706 RepID=UPI001E53E52E|nr:TIGR02234 family membrane protein [Streptomyces gobiensis]UGY90840.1 TIGR02234 family membrane protein [Streptomyces gobiensis]
MTSVPPAHPQRAPRRALGIALLGGALGAALVLVAAGQTWGEGSTEFGGSRLPVEVTGSDVTGVPSALALVGLAALVAVFAVRRTGRVIVAALLALCGVGVAVAALIGAGDTSALDEQAADGTGLARSAAEQVTHSGWPYAAALGGALLLVAGALALRYGREWPAMGGRYERAGGPRNGPRNARRRAVPAADPERPEELWRALDRGEDPTSGNQDKRS